MAVWIYFVLSYNLKLWSIIIFRSPPPYLDDVIYWWSLMYSNFKHQYINCNLKLNYNYNYNLWKAIKVWIFDVLKKHWKKCDNVWTYSLQVEPKYTNSPSRHKMSNSKLQKTDVHLHNYARSVKEIKFPIHWHCQSGIIKYILFIYVKRQWDKENN